MSDKLKYDFSNYVEEIDKKYQEDPVLAKEYVKGLINKVSIQPGNDNKQDTESSLRKEIQDYYLPKQLIEAIIEKGEIPKHSMESQIGIGFIDIADYSFLSKFLSPNENHIVLNGLYAAFSWVLKRHGGYLNKTEGDSIMFHFGGTIDPLVKDKNEKEAVKHIARALFYTCIEMQRVCFLFNQANDKFLHNHDDEATYESIQKAFAIIKNMRSNKDLSSIINAVFQIRIRIGANIGEVTVGNFGPDGAKQWDIIGVPVIKAKRMEATAPIGGFRISEDFYNILNENGIIDAFYQRFKREANALFSSFKDILKEELFSFGKVLLKDKKNVSFNTYSVQVNAGLPEVIANQIELLLGKDEEAIKRIIILLQYYRGNRFVINAVEKVLIKMEVDLRKDNLLKLVFSAKYKEILKDHNGNEKEAAEKIAAEYSLIRIFEKLGEYQDLIKKDDFVEEAPLVFTEYDEYIKTITSKIKYHYTNIIKTANKRVYFYNYVFPLVFENLKASFLEYQKKSEVIPEL